MSDPVERPSGTKGWTSKMLIKIEASDASTYDASDIIAKYGQGNQITLNLVRNADRSTSSPKQIVDTIYYENADMADQPHRHTITVVMPSNHPTAKLLEEIQAVNAFFKLIIEDTADKWAMVTVIFQFCKVTNLGEPFVADDMPYVTYEIASLRKTLSDK
jgi:hypothetical protein